MNVHIRLVVVGGPHPQPPSHQPAPGVPPTPQFVFTYVDAAHFVLMRWHSIRPRPGSRAQPHRPPLRSVNISSAMRHIRIKYIYIIVSVYEMKRM